MTINEKLPKSCQFFTLTFKLKLLRETALHTNVYLIVDIHNVHQSSNCISSSIVIQLTQDGIIGRVHSRFEFTVLHSNLMMYNFGH